METMLSLAFLIRRQQKKKVDLISNGRRVEINFFWQHEICDCLGHNSPKSALSKEEVIP